LQQELASPHKTLEPLFLEMTGGADGRQLIAPSPDHSSRANQS